jgi:hypothetical protein
MWHGCRLIDFIVALLVLSSNRCQRLLCYGFCRAFFFILGREVWCIKAFCLVLPSFPRKRWRFTTAYAGQSIFALGIRSNMDSRFRGNDGDTRRKLVTSLEDTSNNHLFRRPSAGRGPAPLTILKSLGPDLCRDDEQKSMWRFATRRRLITTLKEASSNDIQRHQSVAPAKAGAQRL